MKKDKGGLKKSRSAQKTVCYSECGRLCGSDEMTHLFMRLDIVEGDLLEYIDQQDSVTMRQLIKDLTWEPCLVTMAVGLLIREGLVSASETGKDILIKAA